MGASCSSAKSDNKTQPVSPATTTGTTAQTPVQPKGIVNTSNGQVKNVSSVPVTQKLGNHVISEPTGNATKKVVSSPKRLKGVSTQDVEDDDPLKVVVCGTGESGKTTFLKNLKINFLGGLSEKERKAEIIVIRGNIIEGMMKLVQYIRAHGSESCIPEEIEDEVDKMVQEDPFDADFSEYVDTINRLWEVPEFKTAYQQPDQTEVTDNMDYFFSKASEIAEDSYVPSDDDILKLRKRTIGIQPMKFDLDNARFLLHDVGGQNSERKYWNQVLKGTDAVIWVVSLSEFDRKMFEELDKDRWSDAISLFDATVNGEPCINCPVFLICNKWDRFQEKIKNTDTFTAFFPDYNGDAHDPMQASDFIISQFKERVKNINIYRTFKEFRMSAIDKTSVSEVTEGIFNDLLRFFDD